ncbi:Maltose permease MAL31-like protein 8 [Botrytis cinerea]
MQILHDTTTKPHVQDVSLPISSPHVPDKQAHLDAQTATEIEHSMSFRDGLRLYPAAIACLYATPAFQRDFGYKYKGDYIVSAQWQTALGMGNPIGQVVGALLIGFPMEWYGRKWTYMACVSGTAALIFVQFFARSLPVLLVGELIGGLILGTYTTIAPTYASEVCPIALRGHLTSYVNLCFVMGQLIANGVIAGTSHLDNHWAYSAPFAIQWLWPLIILIGIPFAPESPWWLVRKDRLEEAEKSLNRLSSEKIDNRLVLAMMIETDRLELEMETGTTYWDVFNKTNIRRTEIAIAVFVTQVFSGIYFVAGLAGSKAFDMSVGFLAVGFVGTLLSWILISKYGRRRIYNIGLAVLTTIMFVIGILDCVPNYENRPGVIWAQSTLMIVWNGIFDLTIGPVCYTIFCEVSATKVRSKTIAVATAMQALVGIVMTVAIPYMINPDQANWRGKIGFFYGGCSVFCLIWCWLRVPETKGRTYEELDLMFARGVKTRDFKHYKIV